MSFNFRFVQVKCLQNIYLILSSSASIYSMKCPTKSSGEITSKTTFCSCPQILIQTRKIEEVIKRKNIKGKKAKLLKDLKYSQEKLQGLETTSLHQLL